MKHMRSINTGKSWVTCAKLLPLTNKLAVSSFNRSMKIFDLQTYEMCGQVWGGVFGVHAPVCSCPACKDLSCSI